METVLRQCTVRVKSCIKSVNKELVLAEREWARCLFDVRSRVAVEMAGHPFRFPRMKHWDTGRRSVNEHLVYFLIGGRCQAQVGSRRMVLAAGEGCWISPGVAFRFRAPGDEGPPVVCRFRFTVQRGRRRCRMLWPFRVCRDAADALRWAERLAAETEASSDAVRALLVLFARSFLARVGRRARSARTLPAATCHALERLAAENSDRGLRPSDLARAAGLSPDYFARLFRASFGLSARSWLTRRRLQAAARLLAETNARIGEVAVQCGYSDLYFFSRQFRREFGLSPRPWRKREGA